VATPLSFERDTGKGRGSVCGWLLSKGPMRMLLRGIPKTLLGLRGGTRPGSGSSRGHGADGGSLRPNVIQLISAQDGIPFHAEPG